MHFEWDDNKRASNLEKHGIDFQDAVKFFDSDVICFEDNRQNYGEQRYIAIGKVEGRLIVTAYTYRNRNIRILSMRKANARERRFYARYIKNRLA
ncbi:MAG: BrnT family toxin [Desulfohalobiaceae bacterium]